MLKHVVVDSVENPMLPVTHSIKHKNDMLSTIIIVNDNYLYAEIACDHIIC